jgi:hypothetical protein
LSVEFAAKPSLRGGTGKTAALVQVLDRLDGKRT